MSEATFVVAAISASAAVASAVAAGGAWRAAWRSGRSTEALISIEAARRWQELMPTFDLRLAPVSPGATFVHLDLELLQPVALQQLESLTVRIRDDRPGRDQLGMSSLGSEEVKEQIRRQVWGPFRFTPHVGPDPVHRADADGREVVVEAPLEVGERLRFQLEPTQPPSWMHYTGLEASAVEQSWREMVGTRIRLSITAHATNLAPWVLPLEIAVGEPQIT